MSGQPTEIVETLVRNETGLSRQELWQQYDANRGTRLGDAAHAAGLACDSWLTVLAGLERHHDRAVRALANVQRALDTDGIVNQLGELQSNGTELDAHCGQAAVAREAVVQAIGRYKAIAFTAPEI